MMKVNPNPIKSIRRNYQKSNGIKLNRNNLILITILYIMLSLTTILVNAQEPVEEYASISRVELHRKINSQYDINGFTKEQFNKQLATKEKEKFNNYIQKQYARIQEEKEQRELAKQSKSFRFVALFSDPKENIAYYESGGDYNNHSSSGKYVGKYQIDKSYFDGRYGGDGSYSPENQEHIFQQYINDRYGGDVNKAWNTKQRTGIY